MCSVPKHDGLSHAEGEGHFEKTSDDSPLAGRKDEENTEKQNFNNLQLKNCN